MQKSARRVCVCVVCARGVSWRPPDRTEGLPFRFATHTKFVRRSRGTHAACERIVVARAPRDRAMLDRSSYDRDLHFVRLTLGLVVTRARQSDG